MRILINCLLIICIQFTISQCQDLNTLELNRMFVTAQQDYLNEIESYKKSKPDDLTHNTYSNDLMNFHKMQGVNMMNYHGHGHSSKFVNEVNQATQIGLAVAKKLSSTIFKNENDVIPKLNAMRAPKRFCPFEKLKITCDPDYPYRSYDGSCNNLENNWWGKTEMPFKRYLEPDYLDGINELRGSVDGNDLPNPRDLACALHSESYKVEPYITNMFMQWGQFINHDITSFAPDKDKSVPPCTKCKRSNKCIPMMISNNETCNCINRMNHKCIELARSAASFPDIECSIGKREQLNLQTSFIDGSIIYGSSVESVEKLKNPRNRRFLAFQTGQYAHKSLLPADFDSKNDECLEATNATRCFLAGDSRVNQNPALISMQTIFVREHNRIAAILSQLNPQWNEDTIFEETRRVVIAIIQHITYNEYVTILLSSKALSEFGLMVGTYDYNSNVDPRIANDYAAGAGRFGHSMIRSEYSRLTNKYKKEGTNSFILRNSFFRANMIYDEVQGGLESIIRGLLVDPLMKVDRWFSRELTQHLFETFDELGVPFHFDLVSINIARGRDHGIPSYARYREYCGLEQIRTWTEMKKYISEDVVEIYKNIYSYVDDVDLFTAVVSEYKEPQSLVGPTLNCILGRQFRDLKFGDRFWYESSEEPARFTPDQLKEIKKVTLSKVLCRTMYDTPIIQPNAFLTQRLNQTNSLVPCIKLHDINWEVWRSPKL